MNIRVLAIALIINKDRILVMECFDKVKQEKFYRPIGGGIEFTETGEIALKREFQEEMSADILDIEFLRIFENIFVCDGVQGHEIVLLYKAEFQDRKIYLQNDILCNESGVPFIAKWVSVDDFIRSREILYPDGLTEYLEQC